MMSLAYRLFSSHVIIAVPRYEEQLTVKYWHQKLNMSFLTYVSANWHLFYVSWHWNKTDKLFGN